VSHMAVAAHVDGLEDSVSDGVCEGVRGEDRGGSARSGWQKGKLSGVRTLEGRILFGEQGVARVVMYAVEDMVNLCGSGDGP
jgi:hypothetical protein